MQFLKPKQRGADTQAAETWLPGEQNPVQRAGWMMEKLSVAFLSEHCPFQPYPAHVSQSVCQYSRTTRGISLGIR